ncbi:hypothetical protein GGF42_006386 [Coemansia sp. RSA 2424]|nr:hypothetical protein GGF42_006386 [Coemansia sp. RSA 2424]
MGLNSPPSQHLDQFQQIDPVPNMDQLMHFEQLSQGELSVVQQLRRLQQQRAQHTPVAGRHEPLGMLTHDMRQYLEIRQGFSPILVPTHMLATVRQFISDNLPRHVQALRERQGLSPPQTPHPAPTPAYYPMSPGAEPPATPQVPASFPYSNNASSLSDLGVALAQSSGALPGSPLPPQYSVTSPLASGAPVLSSAMASFGSSVNAMSNGLGITSSPHLPSYMDTDDASSLPQEAGGSQAMSTLPVASVKKARKASAAKPRKSATLLRKFASSSPPPQARRTGVLDYFSSDDNDSALSDGKEGSKKKAKRSASNETDSQHNGDGECANEEIEEHLRKPPNAFILYRQAKNLELRTKTPRINVEAASKLIGSSWKTEDEAVKSEFHEMARQARDLYFAKKKRIQAIQRVKKAEREELALSPLSRTIAKPRRQTSGGSELACHLVVATARNLDSFSPEALAPMSAISRQEFTDIQATPVTRSSRSLTLDLNTQLPGSSELGRAPLLASSSACASTLTPALSRLSTGTSFAMGGPSEQGPFFGDAALSESAAQSISQQVATSLEHLKAVFSESPQSSSLTAMSIDPSPPTAPSTTAEWAAAAAASVHSADHGGWDSMLNSLLRNGN